MMNNSIQNLPVVQFKRIKVDKQELQEAAAQGKGTEFFQQFGFGWLVQNRQPLFAFNEIERVLKECRDLDLKAFEEIHKGGPYYWHGMAAYMVRDYETAIFFMDEALAEDLRQDPSTTESPAMLFIALRGDHPDQAAREFVVISETWIRQLIRTYLKYQGRSPDLADLTIQDLRSDFLLKAVQPNNQRIRSVATALISFSLEFNSRMSLLRNVVSPSSFEPFILHLFKGGLLLESLIKLNPKNPPPASARTLNLVLQHVSNDLGIPSGLNISANELQDVIDQSNSATWTLENAFQITGQIRNTTGHSLGWDIQLSFDEYGALVQHITVACLHTVSTLYVVPNKVTR